MVQECKRLALGYALLSSKMTIFEKDVVTRPTHAFLARFDASVGHTLDAIVPADDAVGAELARELQHTALIAGSHAQQTDLSFSVHRGAVALYCYKGGLSCDSNRQAVMVAVGVLLPFTSLLAIMGCELSLSPLAARLSSVTDDLAAELKRRLEAQAQMQGERRMTTTNPQVLGLDVSSYLLPLLAHSWTFSLASGMRLKAAEELLPSGLLDVIRISLLLGLRVGIGTKTPIGKAAELLGFLAAFGTLEIVPNAHKRGDDSEMDLPTSIRSHPESVLTSDEADTEVAYLLLPYVLGHVSLTEMASLAGLRRRRECLLDNPSEGMSSKVLFEGREQGPQLLTFQEAIRRRRSLLAGIAPVATGQGRTVLFNGVLGLSVAIAQMNQAFDLVVLLDVDLVRQLQTRPGRTSPYYVSTQYPSLFVLSDVAHTYTFLTRRPSKALTLSRLRSIMSDTSALYLEAASQLNGLLYRNILRQLDDVEQPKVRVSESFDGTGLVGSRHALRALGAYLLGTEYPDFDVAFC
ncbi:hypothetical protein GMRT_10110 [Giardia muris]|uniref:Uncharacterized protein n=1 Tax=Giardia muris TaxID=5742 RepID=A0A4Z1SQ20_GIAMU|nr:hypothetical protein GMRT_10110 [Giardia muris]|eukprot:TNJ27760.1 hypothetical protein GMRT_10110 [Giardia muris]